MARIRSVHPGLTTDEAFMAMSAYAKAAWAPLWTECDDNGVFEWKPIVLKARILPADNVDFSALLDEWQQLGVVCRFDADGKAYGAVRNFCKFQRPKKPQSRYPLPEAVLPFVGTRHSSTKTSSEPVPTKSEKSPQMEDEGGRNEGGKRELKALPNGSAKAHAKEIEREFHEQFWPTYPHKVGKGAALTAFQKARRKTSLEEIIQGLQRYIANKPPEREWCNPATWLNQERWCDEPAAVSTGPPQAQLGLEPWRKAWRESQESESDEEQNRDVH